MQIAVIGLGSVLMQDDAVGPFVVRSLEASWILPPGVSLLDLGTPGPELVGFLRGYDALVIIDSIKLADASPGDVRCFRLPEILAAPPPTRLSPHDPSLREALLTADLCGELPESVLLVGVVPEVVALGTGLTSTVRSALPLVEGEIERELERLGVTIDRSPHPAPLEIWWERPTVPSGDGELR